MYRFCMMQCVHFRLYYNNDVKCPLRRPKHQQLFNSWFSLTTREPSKLELLRQEFIGDEWISLTKDQKCGKHSHGLTSSWYHNFAVGFCPACRTSLIATRFWVVMICPIIKCLTVLEFSFILFDLCLFITIFNFIWNYVPIVTFWILTYHKIWILLIIFCFIWSYWIIYFLTCLEVFWSVVS